MLSRAALAVTLAFLEEPVAFGQGTGKVGELSSRKANPAVYDLDAVFNVHGDLAAPKLELAMANWTSSNSDSESKADGILVGYLLINV